jgi:Fic family protein
VIGQVGVRHVAPKPQLLPKLMSELFLFIKSNSDYTPLVLSSIIHYEIEFIHPFQDGNGRMGRFWQHLMLIKYHPAFEFVPVESIIHTSQQNYYDALQASDKEGQATQFVVYALAAIHAALKEFTSSVKRTKITVSDRLNSAKEKLNGQWFDRKKYIEVIGGISTATASRDLKAGLESKQLKSRGEHRKTEYCFV